MILIVRGPDGQRRAEVNGSEALGPQLCEIFSVPHITVSLEMEGKNVDCGKAPISLGMKNGEVVYVKYEKKPVEIQKKEKQADNTIKRERDELKCKHDANAMCSNCAPLDPWDEKYYKDKMIKYLSFGSYFEMLKSKGKEVVAEEYTRMECQSHGANAVCSKCQQRDVVLMPQVFRMVDHIEFDCQELVENFIKRWRESGRQRFGYLVGRYEEYSLVPMGMKAVVNGIWEPEQEDFPDGFVLKEDGTGVFDGCSLGIVGMIYTDIHMGNEGITSDRLVGEYFLSSLEILFLAEMQLKHPHVVVEKKGKKNVFGSRFVSVVVTAGEDGDVVLREYQVSNQCMALAKEGHLHATEDPKKLVSTRRAVYRTRESASMVVADLYLPGDFFLVRLTHGCKQGPLFKNAMFVPRRLSARKMAEYFDGDFSFERFSDFGLLMRLRGVLSEWKELFDCVVEGKKEVFERIAKTKEFAKFVMGLEKYKPRSWECGTCTFINEREMCVCEMCGTERVEMSS